MFRSLLLCLALAAPLAARADGVRGDHDEALEARRSAHALPLAELLARVERDYAGRVIKVELEHDDGAYLYEFKLLTRDGRLIEVELDAESGAVAGVETRDRAPDRGRSERDD